MICQTQSNTLNKPLCHSVAIHFNNTSEIRENCVHRSVLFSHFRVHSAEPTADTPLGSKAVASLRAHPCFRARVSSVSFFLFLSLRFKWYSSKYLQNSTLFVAFNYCYCERTRGVSDTFETNKWLKRKRQCKLKDNTPQKTVSPTL